MKKYIVGIFSVFLLAGFDQWTKWLAVEYLKGNPPIEWIPNVFVLTYLENRGAAFGMFQNQRWIFLIFTSIITLALIYFYIKIPNKKRYVPLRGLIIGLVAGAFGNMIDRLYNGYVVDFFYFKLIDFPVFNVADIYVVVSAVILVFLYLFYYEEDEFTFLTYKRGMHGEREGKGNG